MYLYNYNNAIQLGAYYENDDGIDQFGGIQEYNEAKHIVHQGAGIAPTPTIVTIDALTPDMEGKLIQLNNVQFRSDYLGQTWADANYSANRILTDSEHEIIVRTSNYASFASNVLPELNGTLVGIFSVYRNDLQLIIRNTNDVTFTVARLDDGYYTPQGQGTKDDPYNVTKAKANNSGSGWVKGYIVGAVDGISWADDANFEGPFVTKSNIIIADSPDETRLDFCMPVQLPTGAIRDALNLSNNPSNKGKEVLLYGDLTSYFGQSGLKNLSGYWLDGNGINPAFFHETFTSTIGSFSKFAIGTSAAEWYWATYDNGCMAANAKDQGANELWLVSPAIDLSNKTTALLSFRHAWNFKSTTSDITLWASADYDCTSSPDQSGSWTQVTIPTYPVGTNWTFIDSGDINLSAYLGGNLYIAFKYLSSATKASAWEIGEVKVRE